ncbi:oxidoreductase [Streptomyces jumonjinensis]|uniref:SDR family NAD(P)-dependent oxidoreductase n=1 Tax=Streptomyces jumonjinensis TaxID=1945 RepID=A0A646KDR5_STRJU|nr:oxidoreductase [Streptomyces jumonjinensis]MQT00210.1 SDR family NAD(P)-dependent oxidoreductase [Streptomyces jumonjinensis]
MPRAPRTASGTGSAPRLPDQTGRVAVVTGANSGIGYVTARELARSGARVVMACRSPERGRAALERLRAEVPGAAAETGELDLGSLDSIRAFAERELPALGHDRIDLLINNAGIAMAPLERTSDGFESHFGVNHLGAFALTGLLLPRLLAGDEPRVVTVSSEGQRFGTVDLGNLNAERGYRPGRAYMQSKRANIYFAVEFQRRLDASGLKLRSMVVAPGNTRSNIITGRAHERGRLYAGFIKLTLLLLFSPTPEGARTTLYAATRPDLPGGSYVVPDGLLQRHGNPTVRGSRHELPMRDTVTARALWQISERLTGVGYGLPPGEEGR